MRDAQARARAFLAAYAECGDITAAAKAVPMRRDLHYRWLQKSPAYAAAFQRRKDVFADSVRAEAKRRAMDGILEPVFYQGKACGSIRKFSDAVLLRMMEAHCPEFKRKTEISGSDGAPIETRVEVVIVRPKDRDDEPSE